MIRRFMVEVDTSELDFETVSKMRKILNDAGITEPYRISSYDEPMNSEDAEPAKTEEKPVQVLGADNIVIHAGTEKIGIEGLFMAAGRIGVRNMFFNGDIPANFLGFGCISGQIFSFVDLLNSVSDRFERLEEELKKLSPTISEEEAKGKAFNAGGRE